MKKALLLFAAAIGFAMGACAKTIYELSTDSKYLVSRPLADGDEITGTLSDKVNIRIAAGATVTIRDVKIQCTADEAYDTKNKLDWAGLTCLGDATIILEGANTVCGFYVDNPGILVQETCTLTIKGSGSLVATGGAFAAGIGAGFGKPCGNIVIEGGTITAKGGLGAAGIGAAYDGKCGNITISGGNITAKAGSQTGSGYLRHESVDFSGAAGIGAGFGKSCGYITISGGKVTAWGGKCAAGIGSGADSSTYSVCLGVTISGGTVTATGYDSGAGIGSGSGRCGKVKIEGGKINAAGGYDSAGIGSGKKGFCGDINITAGIVGLTAVYGYGATNPIGKGTDGTCGTVTIASMPSLTGKKRSSGEPGTMRVLKTCDLSTIVDEDLTIPNGMTLTGTGHGPKISIASGATVTLDGARIDGANFDSRKWAGLTCLGDATIVLKGQNNLVRGFYEDYPGIFVPPGSTLTITTATQGTGSLEAYSGGNYGAGGGGGAGIGGGYKIHCGNILIKDGWIHAYGGAGCPGIGGGDKASCGNITVASTFAGRIAATAGVNCDNQIGAGADSGTCGTITIPSNLNDFVKGSTRYISLGRKIDLSTLTGDKKVMGGDVLTGTLAGNYKITVADGAMVTLSDATINRYDASCKWAGLTCLGDATIVLEGTNTVSGFSMTYPGIFVSTNKTLTIRGGGSLYASAESSGAGIGGGAGIHCGNIVIEGGTITARGGKQAAAIGSGYYGRCGNISILGGTVIAAGGGSAVPVVKEDGNTQINLGGSFAAGIGTGNGGTCGDITIGEGIESVVAVSGYPFGVPPIGAANGDSTCGTITVADGLSDATSPDCLRTIIQGDLSKLTGDRTFGDSAVLTGTLSGDYKVSIAHGAKVTLRNVTIKGFFDETWNNSHLCWAGITCEGDATIVLEGDNYVRGYGYHFPGIYVPADRTLTIRGDGFLEARSGGRAPGIGAGHSQHGYKLDGGNISIWSGTIDAEGGMWGAGIGGGCYSSFGNIYINGGTITAKGGMLAAGIGSGNWYSRDEGPCGTIMILGGTVTATGGEKASGIGGVGCAGVEIGKDIALVTATCGEDASNPIRCKSTGEVTVAPGLELSTEGATCTIEPPTAATYTVRYRKYDGSGETASEDFECGKTYTFAWLGSDLGWARPGYEFVGWVPWNPDTKPRLCKYVNGQPVKDLAKAGETIDLWAGWKSSSSYRVCFHRCAGPDDLEKMNQVILRNKEDSLAWMDSQIGWKRDGYTFLGWDESDKAATVKYANGAKVKNLAMDGGTKHLYAVWRAKDDHKYPYTVKYYKYDGSGATRTQSFKAGTVQSLLWMDSQLGWSRPGYEFVGWVPWNPDTKPRLCKYANGQKVVDLASKSGEVVSLYPAWKSSSSYRVCFNRNDGTGVKMNQVILRNKEDNLAWMDSMIGWKREGYVFKGWAESEKGAVKYANGAKVKNLAMDGGTKHLYAIWRLAD